MASTEIHGGQVVYELVGPPDGQPIALTPGGRFSKDVPGLRPLAEALAQGGLRVLLANIKIPAMIIRGGENDLDHPKRTSMEVHCLIEDSILVEPPWPEDAWEQAVIASARGTGNIFDPWVQAAPLILDFFP